MLDPADPDLVAGVDGGAEGLKPLFETLLDHIPGAGVRGGPSVPSPGHQPRRVAVRGADRVCRVRHGTLRKGQPVAWCRADGTIETVRITELYVTEALDRVDAEEVGPGEIMAIAGLADVTIGETLTDPEDPRPLPVTHVDDPSLSMTVGINTSPLSGQDGDKLTARQVKTRPRHRAGRQRVAAGAARPTVPTRGRCKVAASCSSRCSWR